MPQLARHAFLGVGLALALAVSCGGGEVSPASRERLLQNLPHELRNAGVITVSHVEPGDVKIEFVAETELPVEDVLEFFRGLGRDRAWVECASVKTVAGTLLVFGQDTCSAESPAIFLRSEEGATIIEGELFVEGPSEGEE